MTLWWNYCKTHANPSRLIFFHVIHKPQVSKNMRIKESLHKYISHSEKHTYMQGHYCNCSICCLVERPLLVMCIIYIRAGSVIDIISISISISIELTCDRLISNWYWRDYTRWRETCTHCVPTQVGSNAETGWNCEIVDQVKITNITIISAAFKSGIQDSRLVALTLA